MARKSRKCEGRRLASRQAQRQRLHVQMAYFEAAHVWRRGAPKEAIDVATPARTPLERTLTQYAKDAGLSRREYNALTRLVDSLSRTKLVDADSRVLHASSLRRTRRSSALRTVWA